MPLLFIIILLFSPILVYVQEKDQIILPEITLSITDQSSINTVTTEDALLHDRNPNFKEVYLEELSAQNLSQIDFSVKKKAERINYYSEISALYGSFNNFSGYAYSQNQWKNLSYRAGYAGNYHDNLSFRNKNYQNTSSYSNQAYADFSYSSDSTLVETGIAYHQQNTSIYQIPLSQNIQYVPIHASVKHWFDDTSYIMNKVNIGVNNIQLQDLQKNPVQNQILTDTKIDLGYYKNFAEWNRVTIEASYLLNSYASKIAHTGRIYINTDFDLGKGFSIHAGGTFVSSTFNQVAGWFDGRLAYNYQNIFFLDLKTSGEFSPYSAEIASKEEQFYAQEAPYEYKWMYTFAMRVQPSPYIWMGAHIAYNDYQNRRLYALKDDIYYFISSGKTGLLESGASLGAEYPNIFTLALGYLWQNIPNSWLLIPAHKFEMIIGLGYKPVGFWFETKFTLWSQRNLGSSMQPNTYLLGFKVTQEVHKIASLTIEVDNLLNQDLFLLSGVPFGGIQARGGLILKF